MDWVLLSFAVITPMSASIGMAFSRRDQALVHLAAVKTTLWNIYSAHACWDWATPKSEGRQRPGSDGHSASSYDWLDHGDNVLTAVLLICQDLHRMLTLPSSSRARHRVTTQGRSEAQQIDAVQVQLHHSLYRRVCTLTHLCERFKRQGLPPNEATRIRQWERMVTERIGMSFVFLGVCGGGGGDYNTTTIKYVFLNESSLTTRPPPLHPSHQSPSCAPELLEMIKMYRTPQALRSFARLFSFLLPPFYAPYYGQMAIELNSLGVGIAFSILTCIALTSLFESLSQMEDPFVGRFVLDGIYVQKELGEDLMAELLESRRYHFPKAPPFIMIPPPPLPPPPPLLST